MIEICSVGNKRGYNTLQSKERIVSMETNSPASTSGAKTPLDIADTRRIVIVQIPVHYEDLVSYVRNPEDGLPTSIDLVNVEWEPGPGVLTHGSATAAYAVYQSHARMRKESFLTFPQWLEAALAAVQTQVQLDQNLPFPQTTA
jgi:hypothetical protein